MAQRSAFFDAQNSDRTYASADFARLFASLTGRDGVIAGDGDELAVSPTSPVSMAVQVGLGSAWIQGRHYNLYSAAEVLEIPAADSTNPRIDRIVVRMDTAQAARKIEVYVKEGAPAADPSPPSLTRDTEAWEISLAQVLVEANATEIEAGDITDERDDIDVCGRVGNLGDGSLMRIIKEWKDVPYNAEDGLTGIHNSLHFGENLDDQGSQIAFIDTRTHPHVDVLIYNDTDVELTAGVRIFPISGITEVEYYGINVWRNQVISGRPIPAGGHLWLRSVEEPALNRVAAISANVTCDAQAPPTEGTISVIYLGSKV